MQRARTDEHEEGGDPMSPRRRLTCSFCGKREEVTSRSATRSGLHICDDCATIAARLMHQESSFRDAPISAFSRLVIQRVVGLWRQLITRVRSRRISEHPFLSDQIDGISGRVHGPSSETQRLSTM